MNDAPKSQNAHQAAALRGEPEAAGQGRWQLIETAPKDGTEVLAYREDCGPFIARWTNAAELMTTEEMEREQLDDETLFAEDWFYADFIQGGRADGSEAPTHWMPLPEPPQAASGSRGD